MKNRKGIVVYNYDYSKLGLTLEGEFFISSIFTLQTEIKSKSKRDFLLYYSKNCIFSHGKTETLIKNIAVSFSGIMDQRNFKWRIINGC